MARRVGSTHHVKGAAVGALVALAFLAIAATTTYIGGAVAFAIVMARAFSGGVS